MQKLFTLFFIALITFGCSRRKLDPQPPKIPVAIVALPSIASSVPVVEIKPTWGHVLGSFSTDFKNEIEPRESTRGYNIRYAAQKLTGTVVAPGERFSFNAVVGPRSEKNGFRTAPVIYMGVLEAGMGGGVCQVSSTLNAAVLQAGLKPAVRTSHSRPPSYILKGLDATVSWPECADENDCYKLDYQFENTYSFPIGIRAEVEVLGVDVDSYDEKLGDYSTHSERLTFTLYGSQPLDTKVEFKSSFKPGDDFKVRYRRTNKYRTDRSKKIQEGKPGSSAVLKVTTTTMDGQTSVTRYESNYKPVDEVWEVGLAFQIPE